MNSVNLTNTNWRLKALEIENFRGLIGQHRLDVDADLILIDGPNGYGKTSLLEAIVLVLTGSHPTLDANDSSALDKLLSRNLAPESRRPNQPTSSGGVTAHCKSLADTPGEFDITLPLSGAPDRPSGLGPSMFTPKSPHTGAENDDQTSPLDPWRLEARLLSFFQEGFRQNFDDAATGATLSQVFNENPPIVLTTRDCITPTRERLKNKLADIEQKIDHARKPATPANQQFREAAKRFIEIYQHTQQHFADWPSLSPLPPIADDEKAAHASSLLAWLEDLADQWMVAQSNQHFANPARFLNGIHRALNNKIEEYRRTAEKDLQSDEYQRITRELERIEADVNDIERNFPELEKEIDEFFVSFYDAGCECEVRLNAAQWFEILADNARAWSSVAARSIDSRGKPSNVSTLNRVRRQFEQIDIDAARQMAKALQDWIEPRQQAWTRWKDLHAKREKLKEALERIRQSNRRDALQTIRDDFDRHREAFESQWENQRELRQNLADLKKHEGYRDHLRKQMAALDQFEKRLNKAMAPNEKIAQAIRNMTNRLLFRFSLVDGILPVQIDETDDQAWIPVTADGRRIDDLSTGQKAQLAVGMMAAQNLAAASGKIPSVLVLDDVSTSYDLSNLTREALLWRQLAYGGKGKYRRQVFVSSHHEDMTNNLIDLLTPPAGRKMRLLRFTGWSPTNGPTIEQYAVEPTAPLRGREKGAHSTELQSFGEALCQLPF